MPISRWACSSGLRMRAVPAPYRITAKLSPTTRAARQGGLKLAEKGESSAAANSFCHLGGGSPRDSDPRAGKTSRGAAAEMVRPENGSSTRSALRRPTVKRALKGPGRVLGVRRGVGPHGNLLVLPQ